MVGPGCPILLQGREDAGRLTTAKARPLGYQGAWKGVRQGMSSILKYLVREWGHPRMLRGHFLLDLFPNCRKTERLSLQL